MAEYDIALYDANGQMRSTFDVLKDVSEKWETMTQTQRISLGQTLAGY